MGNGYKIKIDSDALLDIEEACSWYNYQSDGLGNRFKQEVKLQIFSLKIKAKSYRIRYDNVRFMNMNKYPFLVYYILNEDINSVIIFGIIHSSRNPKIWIERNENLKIK